MNILVTGASGFLGSALCPQLEKQGHQVVRLNSKSADLTRADSLQQWNGTRFDRLYHLAAWTQAGDFCLRHPGNQWIINQQINTNVLTWWQRQQAHAQLICIGTSCAYAPDRPLTEENYLAGDPIESLFTYAHTKRMLYVGLLALQKQFGMKYLCVVPSTLYGPGYHTDGRQMHFIFDLIRKIIRGKNHGEPVTLWGDGHQKRELVHVKDFVRLMTQLADTQENELVNIGAGQEHSIRDFARIICDLVDFDFDRIEFDTSRYVGAKSKCLSTDKLRTLVPDLQLTPLRAGLAETIDWFLNEGRSLLGKSQ